MEQIKLTQTQTLSSASMLLVDHQIVLFQHANCISERLIADEVLGVRRRYRKGVGRSVKGKWKSSTSSLTFSFGSQSQAEQQRCINERFEAQQRKIETCKVLIAQMTTVLSQPPLEDDDDLGRDQFFSFSFLVQYLHFFK